MFANHGKEDGIYPFIAIEIAKHKRKIIRSIIKKIENITSGFAFSTY
jgi:hypothetical protein